MLGQRARDHRVVALSAGRERCDDWEQPKRLVALFMRRVLLPKIVVEMGMYFRLLREPVFFFYALPMCLLLRDPLYFASSLLR